jgi:hypothetical protein
VLGGRVAARAHVGRELGDARDHLVLQVGVALDEARAEALADAQQVVEDEHLAVGRRAGADADDDGLHARHEQLGHSRRDRLEDHGEAACLLQGDGLAGDPLGGDRIAALGLVAAQRR